MGDYRPESAVEEMSAEMTEHRAKITEHRAKITELRAKMTEDRAKMSDGCPGARAPSYSSSCVIFATSVGLIPASVGPKFSAMGISVGLWEPPRGCC